MKSAKRTHSTILASSYSSESSDELNVLGFEDPAKPPLDSNTLYNLMLLVNHSHKDQENPMMYGILQQNGRRSRLLSRL